MQIAAVVAERWATMACRENGRSPVVAACVLMLLALFVPTAHAQVKNGGFEAQNFSEWKLERYTRSSSALSVVPPTNSSQLTLGAVQETVPSSNTVNTAFGGNVRILTAAGTAANTGGNGARYPFSGTASSLLGGNGARAAYAMEQEATMVLSDVDPVDGKVHLRFAMAPVLNNPNHPAGQQPFFFVEVINLTKGNTQLFHTFNYSNQAGIPWQSFGAYQFTNWQGFDISPGNGRLDVGDQIRLKVYVANCSAGAADHTAQVYMDVFGSKMPGLSVSAVGPSTTKPGEQVTYTYNYVNNSGVYALGSIVRLAAPITENGLPLTFVPNAFPASCSGPHAGTAPRADYIDCPVGDLVAGAGGSFPVTFTVPSGAATTGPNNVINNGDYDVRANTVSPFIGPLVKTTISPAGTTLIDLGVSVGNGNVPSYLVGGAVAYTITVTNNGPVDANGASLSQSLSGANGTANWTCAVPGGSTASCGASSSGSGPLSTTTANLPVGQSLVYTVNGITAASAGTPVVTVVSVTPPAGMSDSVAANNTDGLSTPVSAAQHLLTAHTTGAGSGRLNAIPAVYACPSGGARTACSAGNLGEGQEAYLTAVADNGSLFKGWTGDCASVTGNECHVQMGTQALQVTANFAQVWIVTPSVTGGTLGNASAQVIEDGQGTSFTFTPTTAGHVPTITTPPGANTCPGTVSGPTAGTYTYTVTPVTQDCAFHVAFAGQPRLEIAKTASIVAPAAASVGVPFDYTITVTNTGAGPTSAAATVTDPVPAGLTLGTLPPGCTTSPVGSQTVVCTIASGLSNVAPGNAASFVIAATPQGAINNTTVSNTATVTGGGDPACATAGSCASAPVDTPIVAPRLEIQKTGPATAVVAVPYDYTITVTNSGTAATSAVVTMTDVVPAGLTIGTLPAGCARNPSGSQTVVCAIPAGLSNAAPGNTATYVIPVTATVSAAASVDNIASIQGGGDPACAAGCDSTPVTTALAAQAPVLSITKSVTSTGPYRLGSVVAYQFVVENIGNLSLTGIVVNDARLDAPAACAATTLAPGDTTTCTGVHTVTAEEVAAGNVHNSATVSGQPPTPPGGPTPPAITSPSSEVDTATEQLPAMTLVKSVTSTGPYRAGSAIAYRFEVENTGNVTLTNVAVSDAMAGLSPLVYAWPGLAGQLQPGEKVVADATYSVTPDDVLAGQVRNSAMATGQPPTPPGGTTPPSVSTSTSSVDTDILPAVNAVDDAPAPVDGARGNPSVGNVYDNDTINGVVVDPSRVTGTVTTPATALNGGPVPVLDPATGIVSVPAGTPAGTYTIGYRLCETQTPDNCDEATVTLTVTATIIDAVEDAFVPIRSGTGGTSPSVLGNDTLGGGPAQIGQVTLVPGDSPITGLVMNPDGTVTMAAGTPPGTYRYPYTLCEVLNPTNCDTADAIVVVSGEALLRVTKTASSREVRTGDLVRYTVSVENLGDGPLVDGRIIDTPPAGFTYVEGSLSVSDGDNAATAAGQSPVRFEGLDIPVGGTARLVYAMRVGAGARAGMQVNQAQAVSSSGEPLSNVATADVMLVADAMVEDSLVFGTVFNDRDGDGWQDSAALSGIRVQGGFAPGAYVAGSTTLDRGAGPQRQADASAPLLHGIVVGTVEGRQSEADPVSGGQVVIRQTLREPVFTDDFVLTSDQGVTLRMDRNGVTSVETRGEAAKGLTAAMPIVERRMAQGADGYVVDYVIGNAGIEERGVPGVRIATVEGLLIETDQFGRYHLAGLSGGTWERGRNVVLKVDPSTLPAGTSMTTDNPLLRRVTPGVPVRFDWGVVLPEQVIEGGSEQLELELGEVQFAPGSAALPARYQPLVGAMAAKVREHQGGEVVIQADGDGEGLAFERANAIKDALLAQLDGPAAKALTVSVHARAQAPASRVAGVRDDAALLGTVLFDTDKATVRAAFAPLLDAIAATLERTGGGDVVIVGHADRRGSHAYNSVLGMQRAKAVFDALAARLSAPARASLRVEIENDPIAPNGARK